MIRDNLTWETNTTLTYPGGNEGRLSDIAKTGPGCF
jgi:hypothetical protein